MSAGFGGGPRAAAPIALVVLLLVLATTSQGAFQVDRWAPLALFVLAVVLAAIVVGRGIAVRSRAVAVALTGIWGLAGWSLLSMLWAQSSASAFVAGDQLILYAAIVTLPFAVPASRRALAATGWAVVIGIGAIALYVLVALLLDGSSWFLAGRLNGPVNYRNATALLFALPVWPLVIATASRANRRSVRAGAFAVATLCLSLVFLTQSRGILLGLAIGGCVVLSVGPDRVRSAWVAILAAGGVAVCSPLLLRPYHAFQGGHGIVTAHDVTVAALASLALTAATFVLGLLIALFDSGLRPGSPQMQHLRRAALAALIVGLVAAAGAGAVAVGNPATFVHNKWNQFRDLNGPISTNTRYASVGGQRYDLWRVALKEFDSAPVIGVGAQNYSFGYYRSRKTNRNLDDPHSVVFSLLSGGGVVAVMLLVLFVGGIAVALRRGLRLLDSTSRRHVVAPVAMGVVLLGQSAVDWIWRIPGLTAIGVFALALGAAQAVRAHEPEPTARDRSRFPAAFALAAAGLVLAVLAVLDLFIYDAYLQRARADAGNPRAELAAARVAAEFDPWSVTPHYLESSAYETLGQRATAFAQLNDALALEPKNPATLGVLGDFEARGGKLAAARGYYRLALVLNPLDAGLRQLVQIGERRPR